jgi:hypothetical protein
LLLAELVVLVEVATDHLTLLRALALEPLIQAVVEEPVQAQILLAALAAAALSLSNT